MGGSVSPQHWRQELLIWRAFNNWGTHGSTPKVLFGHTNMTNMAHSPSICSTGSPACPASLSNLCGNFETFYPRRSTREQQEINTSSKVITYCRNAMLEKGPLWKCSPMHTQGHEEQEVAQLIPKAPSNLSFPQISLGLFPCHQTTLDLGCILKTEYTPDALMQWQLLSPRAENNLTTKDSFALHFLHSHQVQQLCRKNLVLPLTKPPRLPYSNLK